MSPDPHEPTPPQFEPALVRYRQLWWANSEAAPDDVARMVDRVRRSELLASLNALRSRLAADILRITSEFTNAWRRAGGPKDRPRIERVLKAECSSDDPPEKRFRLFSELLIREIQFRIRLGEQPQSSDYRSRFKAEEFQPRIAAAFDHCTQAFSWRFRIVNESPLARGGQAEILLGYDDQLDREVAIKRACGHDEASLERLRREARTLARMADAGVPVVYGIGFDRERLCLAEHLIRGPAPADNLEAVVLAPTFARLIAQSRRDRHFVPDRRNPSFLDLIAKLIGVCRTAATAHRHPFVILHRDLNPNNLLVDARGHPFVIDWGLAVWLNRPAVEAACDDPVVGEMTTVSRGGGTPGYLSPEQAATEDVELTPAADVFSLGACLFELLTGCRVFDCTTPWWAMRCTLVRPARGPVAQQVERLMRRARSYSRAPSPRGVDWQVDAELGDIVRRAIDPDPEARYAHAGELAEALEDWIRDIPPRHRAGPWVRRRRFGLGRWVRRNTLRFVLLTVVITFAVALWLALTSLQHPEARKLYERVSSWNWS